MRLVDSRRVQWQDRSHFLAMSARLMRRILVDHARARFYQKRGGGAQRVTLVDDLGGSDERPYDLVALDDALNALTRVAQRKGQVVELRFFGGLTVEETAHVLGISTDTVLRGSCASCAVATSSQVYSLAASVDSDGRATGRTRTLE
jgi:RNA polymerase sigma factor (TIGR02999 family)